MALTFSHQTAPDTADTREENIPKNRDANGTSQMHVFALFALKQIVVK